MTHEAGIEEAAEMLVIEMSPDAPDMQAARHSARLIVEAYLSKSGTGFTSKQGTLGHMNFVVADVSKAKTYGVFSDRIKAENFIDYLKRNGDISTDWVVHWTDFYHSPAMA